MRFYFDLWFLPYTAHSCDDLDALPSRNGERFGNNFTVGSTLEFKCREGYSLIGQKYLKCLSTGKWSHVPPTCRSKLISCKIAFFCFFLLSAFIRIIIVFFVLVLLFVVFFFIIISVIFFVVVAFVITKLLPVFVIVIALISLFIFVVVFFSVVFRCRLSSYASCCCSFWSSFLIVVSLSFFSIIDPSYLSSLSQSFFFFFSFQCLVFNSSRVFSTVHRARNKKDWVKPQNRTT